MRVRTCVTSSAFGKKSTEVGDWKVKLNADRPVTTETLRATSREPDPALADFPESARICQPVFLSPIQRLSVEFRGDRRLNSGLL